MQLRFLRNVTSDGIKRNIISFVLAFKTTNDLEILIFQRLKTIQQEWGIIRHFE